MRGPKLLALIICVAALPFIAACNGITSANVPVTPPSAPPTPTVTVQPSSPSVVAGATQLFTATVTNETNTTVNWSVNDVPGGNSTVGTITSDGLYTAPQNVPQPATVTIQATSQADASVAGSANVTITNPSQSVSLSVVPAAADVELGATQSFSAQINGAQGGVTWSVSAAACVGAACGTVDANGNFTAPQILPASPAVTVTATLVGNPAKTASAAVTITSRFTFNLSGPQTVNAGSSANYVATLTPIANSSPSTAISWSVTGSGCSGPACGTLTTGGAMATFHAPTVAPAPNVVVIAATPVADPTKAASLSVTVTANPNVNAPTVSALLPASGFAGGPGGFTLRVQGANFVASNPGPGSVIIVGGTPRQTSCDTTMDCTAPLAAADIASQGNLSVQIENPDSAFGNIVNYVIEQEAAAADVISLTQGNPAANGKDILVVEPSTAGSSAPQNDVTLSVAAMGSYSNATGTCSLGAGAITLTRPASGSATADICIFSVSGLDPSFTYTITGPAAPDIAIIAEQPLGLGIVDLTLSIPAAALPGRRSLFIENPNKDKAVASGVLEVQ